MDPFFLEEAQKKLKKAIEIFWDKEKGGFFSSSYLDLPIRRKEFFDGVLPTGNSLMYYNLFLLFHITGDPKFQEYKENLLLSYPSQIEKYPASASYLLLTLLKEEFSFYEVILIPGKDWEKYQEFLKENFLPHSLFLWIDPKDPLPISFLKKMERKGDDTTSYICKDFSCNLPISSFKEFKKEILSL